ncbi:uv radiation resistance protein [Niveomyces insectorum RCEF 264]|uniref:Uv radiation resistance protein n=1 Tax=Niveomyces insectorum RCEF 264 TaxID=1081102 RepID=A0A167N957_9HYPO|nr:uv radiation resistance protein [Niveomyces insectorum RCEF 264]
MMAALQSSPYLLPQHRKLRHLRGIYLRNLTFAHPRKYSIDDATINKSPEKQAALRQVPALQHAHSSGNLRTDKARHRRVTLSGATAQARQRILEQALESSTAEAFFSLHCDGAEEPLYVSEVEAKAANFNFRFFDLSERDPYISRSSQMTVRVWVCRAGAWSLLVEDNVDLRALGCIGSSLQGTRFPPNCLVFQLLDGIYMFGATDCVTPPKQAPALPTASYNALMRLTNLENTLQDSFATQDKLAAQINDLLAHEEPSELPEAEAHARRVARGVSHQRRLVSAATKKRDDIAASIQARRAAIAGGRALQQKAEADVAHAAQKLASSRATVRKTLDAIRGQRRRVCEDLMRIVPIVPAPSGQPLSFHICGLPLPNTEQGGSVLGLGSPMSEDALSAALGYVALLANALQSYLSVALPYKITAYGSRSVIRDDISKLPDQQRDFPLYVPRGGHSSQYRFDYGWFLLNKDVETLCAAQGLKVVDIRHTLPNLKYLLYVCSAGSEDLPERKKGGVRGLWMGHLQRHSVASSDRADDGASINSADSRQDSVDSFGIPARRQPPVGAAADAANQKNSAISQPMSSPSTLHLPFDEETVTWTLRTKGMRENADG